MDTFSGKNSAKNNELIPFEYLELEPVSKPPIMNDAENIPCPPHQFQGFNEMDPLSGKNYPAFSKNYGSDSDVVNFFLDDELTIIEDIKLEPISVPPTPSWDDEETIPWPPHQSNNDFESSNDVEMRPVEDCFANDEPTLILPDDGDEPKVFPFMALLMPFGKKELV